MTEQQLREDICEIGRRLYARGLVAGSDGNISIRLGPDHVLCTPTLVSKGYMTPGELAIVDLAGRQLAGPRPRSSEALVHLAIYRHRPDVQAVIHAHPPHATAFALTHTEVPTGIHPELDFFLGPVPLVPYVLTGTQALADEVAKHLDRTSAVLLANHGAVTFGTSLHQSWANMEMLDGFCRLVLLTQPLGGPKKLTEQQVGELLDLKKKAGLPDPRLGR